jgi:hypothetical protein
VVFPRHQPRCSVTQRSCNACTNICTATVQTADRSTSIQVRFTVCPSCRFQNFCPFCISFSSKMFMLFSTNLSSTYSDFSYILTLASSLKCFTEHARSDLKKKPDDPFICGKLGSEIFSLKRITFKLGDFTEKKLCTYWLIASGLVCAVLFANKH